MQLKLRPYQTDAIDAVFDAWSREVRRPAVVLPTGAGKTVVFSHLISQYRDQPFDQENRRVMVLVHRDELADQAMNKIKSVCPDLNVGKVKAKEDAVGADVLVCSVQTLARERRRSAVVASQPYAGNIGLIVTDECHHAAANSYQLVYDAFPDALHVGFTATLARGDGVGLGSTWDEVVYTRGYLRMIADGHLVDPKSQHVDVEGLDLASIRKTAGDFSVSALGDALEDSGADAVIAQSYLKFAADRPGIVFTPTVNTAEQTQEALTDVGIVSEIVTGETSRDDRQAIFDRFRDGQTQVLVNCMVLTEGFDAPWASCAVIARPTQSQPLYVQMVGRVLRPWPGKKDALILNLAGSSGKLRSLIDLEPGQVSGVRAGESLAEAYLREQEELDQPVKASHPLFELRTRDLNMFAGSRENWLRTRAGVWFISGGDVTIFLWPNGTGLWSVCLAAKAEKWRRRHNALTLEMAMAWGEAEAEEFAAINTSKSASWRRGKPTEAQQNYARSLGVWQDDMTKAEASDAISVAKMSKLFDPYVGKF